MLVEEPLAHGVAELEGGEGAAQLRDPVVAEAEAQIRAPIELSQVVIGETPRAAHAVAAIG